MAYSRFGRSGGFRSLLPSGGLGIGLIILAVLAAILIGSCVVNYAAVENVTVLIKGKESVNTSDGHEYRIYTDHGTFVMGDSIIHPRFDTADEYAALDEGKRYACEAYGFRVPLFSSFKNLINCHPAG